MTPDPKPAARIKDPALLKQLHREWPECVLCGKGPPRRKVSMHHIHKHPRDDVRPNLTVLCGDGTSGCHGQVEHANPVARKLLAAHIRRRPDTMRYLAEKLGGRDAADAWLHRWA